MSILISLMTFDPFTVCGIVGDACFVAGYFATVQGWLLATDWRFPAVNMLGALLLLVSLYEAWNLPSVVIECFWAAISLYGLIRSLYDDARSSSASDGENSPDQ